MVVVGAGLTGLTAAYSLHHAQKSLRRPLDLVVLEAKENPGGSIWTDRVQGFTLEGGADSFITNKPQGLDLCRRLGLTDQIICPDERNRRSFVVKNGKLAPVPEGFVLMAPGRLGPLLTTPILSLRGKLRMLMDLVLPRGESEGEESLAAFVRRRFGKEMLDRLIQPLVGGIYTADPNELSLQATLPHFLEMERQHRSLIRAGIRQVREKNSESRNASGARYGLFASLQDGMQTLPDALIAALPAGTVRTSSPARRIVRSDSNPGWRVELRDGSWIDADVVVAATEAHATARLVDGFDPELAMHLRSIPYASSAIAQLAYQRDQIAHPLDGFGAVVPLIEGRGILAISFLSVKFPSRAPAGTVLLRVFIGGACQPELFELEDDRLLALARDEVQALLGVSGAPILELVSKHPRAMPQYTLGHLERVQSIRTRAIRHPGLYLTGNAFDGVGLPDCIRAGEHAACSVLESLADPAAPAAA